MEFDAYAGPLIRVFKFLLKKKGKRIAPQEGLVFLNCNYRQMAVVREKLSPIPEILIQCIIVEEDMRWSDFDTFMLGGPLLHPSIDIVVLSTIEMAIQRPRFDQDLPAPSAGIDTKVGPALDMLALPKCHRNPRALAEVSVNLVWR